MNTKQYLAFATAAIVLQSLRSRPRRTLQAVCRWRLTVASAICESWRRHGFMRTSARKITTGGDYLEELLGWQS